MGGRARLLGVVAALALAGVLLALGAAGAGSDEPVYAPAGTLDLFANDTDGDGFAFTPVGDSTPSSVESFTSDNKARISESGVDLTTLRATGSGAGSQLYPGLKGHLFGVRAQAEGSGTPASQINDSGAGGQTLEIELGTASPAGFAWYAQFGLKFKFGATARIQAYDASGGAVGAPAIVTCDGNDCGPDSGDDRLLMTVGSGDASTLFTSVVISIDGPSDGAVSLLDDPGAGFDTFFDLVETFDGELACDDSVSESAGGLTGEFTRLNTTEVETDCGTLKVYNLDVLGGEIQFVPDPPELAAIYRGDLRFPGGTPANPLDDDLEYDQDGLGPADFELMQWCNLEDADGTHTFPGGGLYFPELAGLGTGGADAFPTLDGLAQENGLDPTSCIVAFDTVQGGADHWVVFLNGDPFYK